MKILCFEDWVADWDDENQDKSFIYRGTNGYNYHYNYSCKTIGSPYMSRQTAEKICDMLNNREIEL